MINKNTKELIGEGYKTRFKHSVDKLKGLVRFEDLVNEQADFENDFDKKAFKHFLDLAQITPET